MVGLVFGRLEFIAEVDDKKKDNVLSVSKGGMGDSRHESDLGREGRDSRKS